MIHLGSLPMVVTKCFPRMGQKGEKWEEYQEEEENDESEVGVIKNY